MKKSLTKKLFQATVYCCSIGSACVIIETNFVLSECHAECGAIVPSAKQGSGIVNEINGAKIARPQFGVGIVHTNKRHACAFWILLPMSSFLLMHKLYHRFYFASFK